MKFLSKIVTFYVYAKSNLNTYNNKVMYDINMKKGIQDKKLRIRDKCTYFVN